MNQNERDPADMGFVGGQATGELVRLQADTAATVKYEMAAMFEAAAQRPRDENVCIQRLKTACARPSFADAAIWSFPRGNQQLEGPSVQLARGIAQAWGNIRKGIRILSLDDEWIHLQGFAHDVERGVLETAEAKIRNVVQRKNKKTQVTEWVKPDERDQRELVNRHGAILERNCTLKVVPADVTDMCVDWCNRTLLEAESGKLTKSRADTIRDLVLAFDDLGVKSEHIEEAIGHSLDTISPDELVRMRGVYKSIKDGNTRTTDHFDLGGGKPGPSGPTSTVKIDLDQAKSVPPQDPAGGQTIRREEASSAVPPKPHWYHRIEILLTEPAEKWLDQVIGAKEPLGKISFRAAAAQAGKDKAIGDAVVAMLEEGAALQEKHGGAPPMHQRLAEACYLFDNVGAKSS